VSSHGDPTDVVPAGRIVEHGPGCRARNGHDGFGVQVIRTFSRSGSSAVDHSSAYAVHYAPVPAVVCRGRHG
jgi:hypothetical protein